MRKTLLAIWLLLPVVAFSQNTPPIGDVYQSGTPQPVEQAFQKLYQITAQITADPSSFYLKAQADKSNWPTVDQAQAQWANAVGGPGGTELTQEQRNNIVPCVAHLNAAISDMERGYQIHVTQPSNASGSERGTGSLRRGQDRVCEVPVNRRGDGRGRRIGDDRQQHAGEHGRRHARSTSGKRRNPRVRLRSLTRSRR